MDVDVDVDAESGEGEGRHRTVQSSVICESLQISWQRRRSGMFVCVREAGPRGRIRVRGGLNRERERSRLFEMID